LSSVEKLVEVYRANGEAEAHLIKGLLEDNAIPCLLRSLAAPSVHAFVFDGMGETRIMVPQSKAEEARELLSPVDE